MRGNGLNLTNGANGNRVFWRVATAFSAFKFPPDERFSEVARTSGAFAPIVCVSGVVDAKASCVDPTSGRCPFTQVEMWN